MFYQRMKLKLIVALVVLWPILLIFLHFINPAYASSRNDSNLRRLCRNSLLLKSQETHKAREGLIRSIRIRRQRDVYLEKEDREYRSQRSRLLRKLQELDDEQSRKELALGYRR